MNKRKYNELFDPIKIGNVQLKNRLAMAPVTNNFTQGGYITEQQIAFLAARAKGGVGLIITGPAKYMMPGSSSNVLTLALSERSHMPGWNDLSETIHAFGAKIFAQVGAGPTGRQMLRGHRAKGASPLPILRIPPENIPEGQLKFEARKGLSVLWEMYSDGPTPEELTIEEIERIEGAYATTARLVKECGLDGAELHFAHGYLGDNFLSPRTNLRTDAYGGNFDNRTRFFRNVVIKSRLQAGLDFVIGARVTGEEHMPGGLDIEQSSRVAKIGEELGLDYIHLTAGCWEAVKWYLPEMDGTMLPEAEVMKESVRIPVITPSLHSPTEAGKAIKEGKTDMVSLGRPLIADPEWVNKVARGEESKIRKCMRCLACLRRTRHGLGLRCEVNGDVGQERYNPDYWRSEAPFKKQYYLPK